MVSQLLDSRSTKSVVVSGWKRAGLRSHVSLLSADFPNYTPGPADAMLAEVTELTDIDELIAGHRG